MALFYHYTDSVEPLSLDEAYLDVSAIPRCHNSATLIARELRASLWRKIGITASAGVAPNKFLAKIASDWHKPDGLFVITPAQVEDFVFTLPVERIPGVGRVTAARLHKRGIRTCGALRQYSQAELSLWFGRFGQTLWQRARGLDDRPVAANRRRRSLSLEHTYEQDLPDCDAVLGQVAGLLQQLQGRYQPLKQEYRIKGWFVKVRFADFSLTCLEESAKVQTLTLEPFQRLFARAWARGQQPVRLLGIGVRFQDDENQAASRQLSLFPR